MIPPQAPAYSSAKGIATKLYILIVPLIKMVNDMKSVSQNNPAEFDQPQIVAGIPTTSKTNMENKNIP